MTKNELLASLNSPDAYILAVVRVESGFAHAPVYIRRFCHREPGFGETAVVFDIDDLLGQGAPPS